MNQLKPNEGRIVNKRFKKKNANQIVLTSTVESVLTKEDIEEREYLLNIHKEKALEALARIEQELEEISQIKLQFV